MFNTSTIAEILKTRYIPAIREMLNNQTVLYNQIRKRKVSGLSGGKVSIALHVGRNLKAGQGRAEGATLPSGGNQRYKNAEVPIKRIYTPIELSGFGMAASKDDAGSYVRGLDSEMQGATRDLSKAVNRQLHSDGRDYLAVYKATGTVWTDGDGHSARFLGLEVGQEVDLINGATHAVKAGGAGLTVTAYTPAPTGDAIVTTPALPALADGDYLVASGTLNEQLMGIRGVISDANPPLSPGGFEGRPVAGNPDWKSQVVDALDETVPGRFSLDAIQELLSNISSNSDYSQNDVKFLLSGWDVYNRHARELRAMRRIVNTLTLDGGFKGIDYSGIPHIADPNAHIGRLYAPVPETLSFFTFQDFDWMDKDGNMLHRRENVDAYFARLVGYMNFGAFARNANGLYDNIDASIAPAA